MFHVLGPIFVLLFYIIPTVTRHADGDALFKPAVLTAVPVDPHNVTLLVLKAGSILNLLLDTPPEETLINSQQTPD